MTIKLNMDTEKKWNMATAPSALALATLAWAAASNAPSRATMATASSFDSGRRNTWAYGVGLRKTQKDRAKRKAQRKARKISRRNRK